MNISKRSALVALAGAGLLWGISVPLSKLAMAWLAPGWVAVARFAVAAPVLAVIGRRRLRGAVRLPVLVSGAIGFGVVIVLQNAGLQRTSVSHAAVLLGAVPALVALVAAGVERKVGRPAVWFGYAIALFGVVLVAGSGSSGASASGDLLVLASAALSAVCIVIQPRLLRGQDPAAMTAIQFAGALAVSIPLALAGGHGPALPPGLSAAVTLTLLAVAGTVLPFWLFAFGQGRVPAQLAGSFVNLEPVVGACAGWLAFGDSASPLQLAGALAVLGGIVLSTWPGEGLSGAGVAQWLRVARVTGPRSPSMVIEGELVALMLPVLGGAPSGVPPRTL